MDTVIHEIANQLGMAVDQAGQFIQEQLPNFAALKIIQLSTPLWILGILALVGLFFALLSFAITKDVDHSVFVLSIIVFFGSLIVFVFWLLFALANIIGWSNYPEAMLIDMALKAVG